LEYQNISCFGTPKSHAPKLYYSPFFCDAAGVVCITNFYHSLANHYTTETVTKLPATADLTLPLLCFCCLCHTAAVLPKALPLPPKLRFGQAAICHHAATVAATAASVTLSPPRHLPQCP
jgi:hypothetical protein